MYYDDGMFMCAWIQAVSSAKSYREKASRLLEEAHRALSRLEQVGGGEAEGWSRASKCKISSAAGGNPRGVGQGGGVGHGTVGQRKLLHVFEG